MPAAERDFRQSALTSGLVTKDQLRSAEAQILERLGDAAHQVSGEELAAELVSEEILTPYQAEQLRAGRTRLHLGPYIITDWIGQGGMGNVYKAMHEVMGRVSAVKVLPREKARTTPDAIAKFQREIRAQAKLDHPNLVRAYDAGEDGMVHYLVTEYIPGQDLRRLVKSEGPLRMRQAASLIMQAALGLEHAHQQGLIHRDVKPGNVLVTPEGVAKVSDLGLAGFVNDDASVHRGKVVGTADYMSPEQILHPEQVSAGSDIYSLGCTLYYSVTSKVPFPGGSFREKARRHCSEFETPMHPRQFNAEITEEFVEVIADMMAKEPQRRVQSAAEVAARLEPWAEKTSTLSASARLGRSPWIPPPLPQVGEREQDTDVGSFEEYESSQSEPGWSEASHGSQWTEPSGSAQHDTVAPQRTPPPPAFGSLEAPPQTMSRGVSVAIALAVSIPLSMLIGAAIALALILVLRG